jgi:aminopeptidase N
MCSFVKLSILKWDTQVPISSYLLAISAGALAKRDLSDRIAVYAEESLVDKAAYDFEEVR